MTPEPDAGDAALRPLRLSPTVVVRAWGSETVAYDDRSGDTYLFSEEPAEVLACLAGWHDPRPPREADLVAALDLSPEPATLAGLRDVIGYLDRLGMLVRCTA